MNVAIKKFISINELDIDELVQGRCNSSALAMELRLSCTNPSFGFLHACITIVASLILFVMSSAILWDVIAEHKLSVLDITVANAQ